MENRGWLFFVDFCINYLFLPKLDIWNQNHRHPHSRPLESRGWFVYTRLFVLARKRIRGRTGSPKWSDTDTRMILAGQTPTKMISAPPKCKTYCAQGAYQGVYDLPSAVHLQMYLFVQPKEQIRIYGMDGNLKEQSLCKSWLGTASLKYFATLIYLLFTYCV